MDLKYLKHLAKRGSIFIHPKGFEATDLLISKLNIKPSDEILEIGCGTGGTLIEIISRYGIKVTAVEILDEMLTAAEENLKSLNLTDKAEIFNIKPGEKYPFENNSFDKIYAESVIGFQDKPGMEFIFSEIRRLIKPNGIFILNDALWKQGVPDSIVNRITEQAYKDFGLAHASPSNIDINGLTKIARGYGLEVKEIIDLDKTIKASSASLNENNVKFNKPKNKFSLVYFTDNLSYRLKLKKHSNTGNYIISYLISFNVI